MGESTLGETAVFGEIKNIGDRVLSEVKITVFFSIKRVSRFMRVIFIRCLFLNFLMATQIARLSPDIVESLELKLMMLRRNGRGR